MARKDVEAWMRSRVSPAGAVEVARERPWATVLRVPVARGQVWFKACGAVEAFEPRLTASLFERSPDRIAEVLGYDAERGWLLLADAGTPVRPPAARKVDDLRRVARPAALALAPYSWSFCEPGGQTRLKKWNK